MLLSVGIVGASLWRLLGAQGRVPLPDRAHPLLWLLKQGAAIAAFVSVYVAYRGQLGREAGVELLAALLGLKLLEMRSARDYYLVAFLCYFLVVTNFFYSQTPATALYMLVLVLFVTTVLIQFNTPPGARRVGDMAALSLRMTCGMPHARRLVLFPPPASMGFAADAFDGFRPSEELTLGEVARLGLSDETPSASASGMSRAHGILLARSGPMDDHGRTGAPAAWGRAARFHAARPALAGGDARTHRSAAPALDLVTEAAPGTRISTDHLARTPVRRRHSIPVLGRRVPLDRPRRRDGAAALRCRTAIHAAVRSPPAGVRKPPDRARSSSRRSPTIEMVSSTTRSRRPPPAPMPSTASCSRPAKDSANISRPRSWC